ncbi:hypothetical protein FDUTEX481_00638 [Tolypothrix sp. PCC 7601]|nr:hypothetical protein FDUTEX481_00638 [Tolypothrix sp. PCC 7601]BAY92680.1 hypothetical protein NIES3275_47170 [Microchaete diplosiphon NIES-3275]
MGGGTAPVRYFIYQKIVDAVPLQRMYLLQTLLELVLFNKKLNNNFGGGLGENPPIELAVSTTDKSITNELI